MKRLFDVLGHVREIVVSSESTDSVLCSTLDLLKTVLGIERCSIMFLDPDEPVLRIGAASTIPCQEWGEIAPEVGKGISGYVVRTGTPLLIENIDESPFALLASSDRYPGKSFMCVPITVSATIAGVINLSCPPDRAPFGSDDLELVIAISGILGFFLERSRLLTQSENSRSHLQSIVESLHSGILTVDLDSCITSYNARLVRLLELDGLRDYRGTHVRDLLPPELAAPVLAMIEESGEFCVEKHAEVELNTSLHGALPVEVGASPLTSVLGETDGVVVTLDDISMRREIAELRRLDEIKSDFLAMVSHELRTPLTSIKGAIHLLCTTVGGGMTEQQMGLVDIVQNNTDRLARIISDLLDIVHIENQNLSVILQPEELGPIIESCVRVYRPAAKAKGITIQESLGDAQAVIDRERLRQVICHLVDNAIKFTPRDGTVGVRLEDNEHAAVIRVRDTGCGVSIESQGRIFTKFYQSESPLTRSAGGMGIGLYLAKCLVELQGGSIRLEHNTGIGSEFVIEFPKSPAAAPPKES
jgi:PAS domain S-box-containing protein